MIFDTFLHTHIIGELKCENVPWPSVSHNLTLFVPTPQRRSRVALHLVVCISLELLTGAFKAQLPILTKNRKGGEDGFLSFVPSVLDEISLSRFYTLPRQLNTLVFQGRRERNKGWANTQKDWILWVPQPPYEPFWREAGEPRTQSPLSCPANGPLPRTTCITPLPPLHPQLMNTRILYRAPTDWEHTESLEDRVLILGQNKTGQKQRWTCGKKITNGTSGKHGPWTLTMFEH